MQIFASELFMVIFTMEVLSLLVILYFTHYVWNITMVREFKNNVQHCSTFGLAICSIKHYIFFIFTYHKVCNRLKIKINIIAYLCVLKVS